MFTCPKCNEYEFKEGDEFCSKCKNKLVSFAISSNHITIQNPKRGDKHVPQFIEFINKDDGCGNKVIANLKVDLRHDASPVWSKSLISLSLDDALISLPYSLTIPPNEIKSIKIDIDPEKLSHEGQEEIAFNLYCMSNDPERPKEFIKICVHSKLPMAVFLQEDSPHNPIEKIEFDSSILNNKKDNEIPEKVFRLYNQGGGYLSIPKRPQKPKWIKLLEYPTKPLDEGSFAAIKLTLDTAKLPKSYEEQQYYQGELRFSFKELRIDTSIPILIPLPPKAKILLIGYQSNQLIFQRVIPCKKGRKLSYTLKVDNVGGGELEIESWKFSEPVDWARFYGFKLESFGQEVKADEFEITLVIDTSRFKPRHTYPLNILVHTNSPESPTCIALEFKCEKESKLDTDNYIAVDFGETNISVAYTDLLDVNAERIKQFEFLNDYRDRPRYTVPSQMLFRDIDDPILGWKIKEEMFRILDKDPNKRMIWNLRRQIGSGIQKEILWKKYPSEQIAEFAFQWIIDRIIAVRGYIPTRIISTCRAGSYKYQRDLFLRPCRRAMIRTLLLHYGREVMEKINQAYDNEFPSRHQKKFKKLWRTFQLKIDKEKYEYKENKGPGGTLIGLMIFALEYKYHIHRGEEIANNAGLLKIYYRLTRYLLDYFKDYAKENDINNTIPFNWEHLINKIENLTWVILHNLESVDVKALDTPIAAIYTYLHIIDKDKQHEQLTQLYKNKEQNILVIDYGRLITDISLVKVRIPEERTYEPEIIATERENTGGEDIDRIIIEKYLNKLLKENKITLQDKRYLMMNKSELKEALAKDLPHEDYNRAFENIWLSKENLKLVAENDLKIYLSHNPSEPKASGYFMVHPIDGEKITETWVLPRSEFNKIIQPEMDKMKRLVNRVLEDASRTLNIKQTKPDKVIFIGKSSQLPQLKKILFESFAWNEKLLDLSLAQFSRSCISLGAAYFGMSTREESKTIGTAIIHHNIGYIKPSKNEFIIVDGFSKGNKLTSRIEAKVELGFKPFRKQTIFIAQSKTDGKQALNNPFLEIIGKYEFIVKDQIEPKNKNFFLNFVLDETGILEIQGNYKDNKKFSGHYYRFETTYN